MILILDYGMGNIRSLSNAFEFLGENVVVSNDIELMESADRLVLPGVGAFSDAMSAIRERNLIAPLNHQVNILKKPLLGVCLGMQLVAKDSQEHGSHQGLGWLDAHVERLCPKRPFKVPHVGWNLINFDQSDWLFDGIRLSEANFYFVHSYHMVCSKPEERIATTDYGGLITAAVRKENIVVTQFHPEKSQDNGLQLLNNWINWDGTC